MRSRSLNTQQSFLNNWRIFSHGRIPICSVIFPMFPRLLIFLKILEKVTLEKTKGFEFLEFFFIKLLGHFLNILKAVSTGLFCSAVVMKLSLCFIQRPLITF